MKKSFFSVFILLIVLGFSFSVNAAQQDPLNAIAALNQALISIDRVEKNPSRQVVDEEYNFLNNNFKLADIPFTPEIQTLINEMMRGYTKTKLEDKDRELIRKRYETQVNRAFLEVKPLSHIRTEAAVAGARSVVGSIDENSGWFKNLLNAGFAGAMALGDYQIALQANERIRQQARGQEQEFMQDRLAGEWQLEKDFIERLNELKVNLMNAQWAILTENSLSDDTRFTQNNLDEFYTFISSKDPKAAIRIGNGLKKLFGNYAPFWFYLGSFYMQDGDIKNARQCFEKFEDINRPIWRVDPYTAANARYKIFTLDETEKGEAQRLLEIIENNSARDDWNNFLFAALQNYQLGNKDKAKQLIYHNIDLNYNKALNEEILRQIEADKFDLYSVQAVAIRDFRDANELEKLAQEGNIEAQLQLGENLFRNGKINEAIKWLQPASDKDNQLAKARLFYINECLNPNGNRKKSYNGIDDFLKADIKSDYAIIQADFYKHGCGVKSDFIEAKNIFLKYPDSIYSQESLGYINEKLGDIKEAIKWYEKASNDGSSNAEFRIAELLMRPGGGLANGEKDIEKGRGYLHKAAKAGNPNAQYLLAQDILLKGDAKVQDIFTETFPLLEKSAKQGHPLAEFELGIRYAEGIGVKKDIQLAKEWFQKAAAQGVSNAKKALEKLK